MAINSPPRAVLPPPPGRHGSDCGLKADTTTPMTDKEEENQNTEMLPVHRRSQPFKKCKKVATILEYLSDDMMFTTLTHLPAQYIFEQARVVCRKWYYMMQTQTFVNEHLQHSRYGILFLCKHPIFVVKPSAMGKVETYKCRFEVKLNFSVSCNGLILEYHRRHSFYILNPATRQPSIIPAIYKDGRVCCSGLGYAAASMEFKVVLVYASEKLKLLQCYILTVGVDKSWRNVQINQLPVPFYSNDLRKKPLMTEVFMHWAGRTHVFTLNVETEVFTMIPIPKISGIEMMKNYFISTGRCLCMFLTALEELLWEVWEMKAETGEWRKMPGIDLRGQSIRLKCILGLDHCSLDPVGWFGYPGLIVFIVSRLLTTWISYNLHSHEIESIHKLPHYSIPKVHKSSL